MFGFILADLRRGWMGAAAVALVVALAAALGVVVTLQERALRLGSARAADSFDLVIGAPGGETQLVLSSVFLQAAPLTLMPGAVMAELSSDPRVAWAAPVGFGDFHEDMPIVGTTMPLVEGLGGLAEGRGFERLGDAVAGALTGLALGASFHPVHGQLSAAGEVHVDSRYTVTGRLAPTGTPWDRAILVPIEGVWGVHAHDHAAEGGGPAIELAAAETVPEAGAAAQIDADPAHEDHEAHGEEDHGHDDHAHDDHAHDDHAAEGHGHDDHAGEAEGHGHAPHIAFDAAAPLRPELLSDPNAPGLPAVIVKANRIADAYNLRQDYRTERTLAVFPAEVLTRLYGMMGDARRVLGAVAMAAQVLVGAAILLVMVMLVLQRQRQIGALRAFGAPRAAIFVIVWAEAALIAMTGVLAGFGLGYLGAQALAGRMQAASGVAMPVEFARSDLALLGGLLAATAVAALLPAALAWRRSPAAALRG